jgi:FtsK/SpoIIIE family/FtsK alpha domain/Ftsk gamma domain/4TM region of DNA translocase FtsK/SpoIIIE
MSAFFREHLGRQADDVWGLILVVLGLLTALGIFFNRTGVFGRAVRFVTSALLGRGSVGVPLAFLAVGWVLIRGRSHEEPVPVAIGSAFLIVSGAGLLHVRHDSLPWSTPVDVLRRGGGLLGMAVAEPLERVVATWGTVIILSVLFLIGCLILLRMRVRDAYFATANGMVPVRNVAGRGLRSLFELGGRNRDNEYFDEDEYYDDYDNHDNRDNPYNGQLDTHEMRTSHGGSRWARRSIARRGRAVEVDGFEAGSTAVALRPSRRRDAYALPAYDDLLIDQGGWPDDKFTEGAPGDEVPAKKKRSRKGKIVDGEAKGWLGGEDAPEFIDLAGAEDASIAAATAPRKPVSITLPPEPVWTEEQPALQNQPLPGLGERVPEIVWKLPPRSILKKGKVTPIDTKVIEAGGRTLEEALAAHGVETRLIGMTVGPTVTRYELELAPGVKVAKVTALHKDIAYAMATADVRMLAPIPGKSAIGVECPNAQRQLVAVGDVLNTPQAKDFPGPLSVAIGRDIDGKPVMVDLAKMPHVLVAGTTGSGKSSCINSLLTSILMRSTPDEVRMILIDPKMVELSQYNGLPHLLTQVVTNPKKAASALQWAVDEMEKRYELLARLGFRDITGYNAAVARGELNDPYADDPAQGMGIANKETHDKMSMILIVVDELADLMMVAARDVEESICRIAQKARAVGIHLVIATQRPSVNVITGLIKANVPSRFAFAVSSLTDSRVILDQPGAERLIGQGDMLMLTVSSNIAQRVQGNFVSEEEIRAVVAFWKKQTQQAVQALPGVDAGDELGAKTATTGFVDFTSDGGVDRIESATPKMIGGTQGAFAYGGVSELSGSAAAAGGSLLGEDDDGDSDDQLDAAMELIVRSQLGSTSMLQRKLRVGFSRAGRIMDLLENKGVVGPSTGSKAREVLMTVEELEALIKRKQG